MSDPIIESIAYLTHPNGTKIQVLKTVEVPQEDGTTLPMQDWDEEATYAAYAAYELSLAGGH
jgi:hypothetical protein